MQKGLLQGEKIRTPAKYEPQTEPLRELLTSENRLARQELKLVREHTGKNEMTGRETRGVAILEKEPRIAVFHGGTEVTRRFPGP